MRPFLKKKEARLEEDELELLESESAYRSPDRKAAARAAKLQSLIARASQGDPETLEEQPWNPAEDEAKFQASQRREGQVASMMRPRSLTLLVVVMTSVLVPIANDKLADLRLLNRVRGDWGNFLLGCFSALVMFLLLRLGGWTVYRIRNSRARVRARWLSAQPFLVITGGSLPIVDKDVRYAIRFLGELPDVSLVRGLFSAFARKTSVDVIELKLPAPESGKSKQRLEDYGEATHPILLDLHQVFPIERVTFL